MLGANEGMIQAQGFLFSKLHYFASPRCEILQFLAPITTCLCVSASCQIFPKSFEPIHELVADTGGFFKVLVEPDLYVGVSVSGQPAQKFQYQESQHGGEFVADLGNYGLAPAGVFLS